MNNVALCAFGVNGVGKSTLLNEVVGMYSGSITVVRGSTILKESLGVVSYEALESVPAQEKKQALIEGMALLVGKTMCAVTIVDTHLIVPIRRLGQLVVEDMWDDGMLKFFKGFAYITAQPSVIADRRRMDRSRSLRSANASAEACNEDLQFSATRWDEVSSWMSHKKVVVNDQTVLIGARKIFEFIQALSS